MSLHAEQDSREISRYFELFIAHSLAKWDCFNDVFCFFFHFLMIIFVINNFCIKQTLYQVYSHIKGQCLTILVMFFISLHHHINIFKLNKKQNSWSNDSKCYFSGLPALLKILTISRVRYIDNLRWLLLTQDDLKWLKTTLNDLKRPKITEMSTLTYLSNRSK